MMIPKSTTLYVVFTIFLCFFQKQALAQEYDLNTTLEEYWPINEVSKPGYLEEFTDPVFGTKLIRISGDNGTPIPNMTSDDWPDISKHGYSTRQPWNADESILWLEKGSSSSGSYVGGMFFDGQTYAPISDDNDIPSSNEARWHPTDPNLMLLIRSDEIASWNYYTDEVTTLMSFSGYSSTSTGNTGNFSNDGKIIAVSATRNSDGNSVAFALDIENNIKYPDIEADNYEIGHLSISAGGNYVVLYGDFGDGYDRTKVYDLNGNTVSYWDEYARPTHYDLAIDQNGDEVAVGVSKSNPDKGKMIKRRLTDGQVTELTVGGWPPHTSARNIFRPGWAFAWTSSSSSYGPYMNEVIAVKLDGSRVERIAQIRTADGDYWNQAQPCPSPSGSRVIYTSDWHNGSKPYQSYIADFRDIELPSGFSVNAGTDQSICESESVTLTASGAESYSWSNGEETASITVTPTETTTYTVTGTDSEGNQDTDSVIVTINSLPTADAGGDMEICEDNSVTLSASGGDSYTWEWSGSQESGQSITVSPQETTTFTVTVTLNGCSSTDEVTVTVKPRPTINAGNDVDIYLGESATLTAVGEGAFEWSTGETTESIIVSPTLSETYTVTATLDGCTNTDSVLVTILDNEESVQANAGDDATICEGENVTLTASGGDNYLWSTGETTQSIEVSPSETTTYTVTVSNSTNSDVDDVIVNVNPIPTAYAGEDQSILHGQAVTLSATGGSEYIWSNGETSQEISVHPTENTEYTVEVIQDGCSDFDTVAVIVNVVADIVDDTTICQGNSTVLSASGGSNYFWSNGETTQNIEVSPTQTTTYSVIVSNGTSSDTASVTVNVNLLPNANAGEDVIIEEGQNVTLSASGGNTYIWNTGDTSQNISVSPIETTTYTVETIVNGCSNFDEVTVTVVPPVDANAGEDVEICHGDEITLTASGGEFFEWSTGDTTASINVTPNQTTMYTVSVSNGVSEEFAEVMVILDNCLDSDGEEDQFYGFDYKVYPNPSNGEVNIKLSGLENISSLYITDILGKTIKTETISANNGSIINKTYNLSSISKGLYFVTFIESGKEAITKKLIIN